MKTNLMGLAVCAVAFTSFAAFANDWDDDDDEGVELSVGWNEPTAEPCDPHAVTPVTSPAPAATADGRYELRSTQQWVPARYEQVTVEQCQVKRHGGHGHGGWKRHYKERCVPVVETRVVPGYYQTVQQWVFVPYPRNYQYSNQPSHRPPMYGQARVGIRFGSR